MDHTDVEAPNPGCKP